MQEHNNKHICIDGNCPEGIEVVRKIGLTPKEKRAIFHSILSKAHAAEAVVMKKRAEELSVAK
jgi:hypothetical protein